MYQHNEYGGSSNLAENIASGRQQPPNMAYLDNETKITMPPSFPQPLPRKSSAQHTPTTYQNLPHNSKAASDPRPAGYRLETATPNRYHDRYGAADSSDGRSQDGGDFRRSASARLPKQKARAGEFNLNTTLQEESVSDKTSDQVNNSLPQDDNV